MHIVIGLIAGVTLGALAGSAALHFAAPGPYTVQAREAPVNDAAPVRSWDI